MTPGLSFSQFFDRINTILPDNLNDEIIHRVWGEMLNYKVISDTLEQQLGRLVKTRCNSSRKIGVTSHSPDFFQMTNFENPYWSSHIKKTEYKENSR